jgi:hypothetical protein
MRDLQHNEIIITYGPLIFIAPITLFHHRFMAISTPNASTHVHIYTQIYMPNNMGEKEIPCLHLAMLCRCLCVFVVPVPNYFDP